MKRTIFFILFLCAVFLLAGVQGAIAASGVTMKPRMQKPTPPDLRATVVFAQVVKSTSKDGFQCYDPRPVFTVKNHGQATAKDFDIKIEWKNNPSHVWEKFGGRQNVKLLGGVTMTIDYNNAGAAQIWCVNETNWKPGWRITADANNDVTESNEGNNVAEKIFTPPRVMAPINPPTAIRKDYQKIPTPR